MNLETNKLIELDDTLLLKYLKWMVYIPQHWNTNIIFNKDVCELSNSDLRILNFLTNEQKYVEMIKQYLKDKKDDNKSSILNYLNKISIEDYARVKLNKEELEYCNNAIKIYLLSDLNVGIKKLQSIKNRSMKQEYILYKLLNNKKNMEYNENKKKIKK